MSESITLSLPRTKCENVRVLFTRIRLLFGVSVDPASDAGTTGFQEQGPPGKGSVMTVGKSSLISCEENVRFVLTMVEGGPEQLNKAKDYLLAACSETSSRCERRCQYAPDIFQQMVPMRDEVERESSAMVRFEPDNLVVISGQERNVLAAIRFLDSKAQDLVVVRAMSKCQQPRPVQRPTDFAEIGSLSGNRSGGGGVQSREIFRQCRNLESEDSSYDSDYENTEPATPQDPTSDLHHDDVSRTVSDTLAAEFAEYVTRDPSGNNGEGGGGGGDGQQLRELAAILADPNYTSRVEFALKLGYTEAQVQIALQKLGAQPSQNELLAELIKLGAAGKGTERQRDELDDIIAEAGCDVSRSDPLDDSVNLRHIVIDGSNVAMSHGNKECFSCRGIKLCVDWFRSRGHSSITVFVPRWRKEVSRPDAPIKDQEILAQLEKERMLVFTPSRHVGGRRMVCYDDRYILRLAVDMDGIVVSNDNYRDLANESPEFKKIVEDRLLMYSFVNDRFMPPDDPLGRHGPSLDNFLRKAPKATEPLPPPCPYGKKCTYGNKCKYYHPERGNQPQKSVTERLAEQAKIQLQEVKSRGLKSRESSPGDKLKSTNISQMSTGSNNAKLKKQPLSRTKSLVPSSTSLLEGTYEKLNAVERTKSDGAVIRGEEEATTITSRDQATFQALVSSSFSSAGGMPGTSWSAAMPQISLVSVSSPLSSPTMTSVASSWAALSPTLPPNLPGSCAEMFLEPDGGGHLFVAKRLSDPDSHSGKSAIKTYPHLQQTSATPSHQPTSSVSISEAGSGNLHRKLQRQLTLNPAYDPRLLQLGGFAAHGQRLMSPQQEQFSLIHHSSEQSMATQRASSQENLHLLQRGFSSMGHTAHQPLSRMGSDSRVANTLQVASQLWEGIAPGEHQTVTRIASAPDSYHQWPPTVASARMQHLNSTSDTRLNLYPDVQHTGQISSLAGNYRDMQGQQHWLVQSSGMDPSLPISSAGIQMIGSSPTWQEQSPSGGLSLGASQVINQPVRPSSVPPQGMQLGTLTGLVPPRAPSPELQDDTRYRLYFHLASIFPKEQVRAAMDLYPQETNPQKICAAILNMFPKG